MTPVILGRHASIGFTDRDIEVINIESDTPVPLSFKESKITAGIVNDYKHESNSPGLPNEKKEYKNFIP